VGVRDRSRRLMWAKKTTQKFKPEIANRGSAIAKVDAEPETIGRRSRVSPGFGGIATVY